MTGERKKGLLREAGAVQIVEASFVFPVLFIVLFCLIYMGNAFFIKAQVESVVETYAVKGAGYCADPILETLQTNGSVPSLSSLEVEPYRYIFGGMGNVERQIGSKVAETLTSQGMTFFQNMAPRLKTSTGEIATFRNYVVYSTFSVEVEYDLTFPIQFLGADAPTVLTIHSRAEVPVNDTAEFIRNTDMVIDLLHGSKLVQSISDAFGKINDFISSFADK